jgi:insulysin
MKNLQNDGRRILQVYKSEGNPASPFCNFATGNLLSLNKPGVRENLLAFYDKYYSANIMKLVILGAGKIILQ